jgi:hypothetical protein
VNDAKKNDERDAVLFALHQESENPTAEQILYWINQYPQFADDIRSHAAIMKDLAAQDGKRVKEPSEALLSRSQSRAMDALHKAQARAAAAPAMSFDQILALSKTDIPDLSDKLNIKRGILSALVSGRMLAPVGERLVTALMQCLSIPREVFEGALQLALSTPRLGHAKAEEAPSIIPRSYEYLVRASSMTEERKKYWLGEE